jgi:hypothetical protein
MPRLSDGALETLLELEAEARDGIGFTADERAEYLAYLEATEADAAEVDSLADWHHDPYAGATHDAAGRLLTDEYPF